MSQSIRMKCKAGILLLAVVLSAIAATTPPPVYTSGFSMTIRLGRELSEALPAKYGEQLDPQVVTLQTQDLPLVTPVSQSEDNRVSRQVSLSAGLIDLVNHISHAKAVDHVQKGYFDRYVRNLAASCTAEGAVATPSIVDARYWNEDVMADQISYFNQMIAVIISINMSHHYLGHYSKYASAMVGADDKPVPINSLLTPDEWDVSVKAGTVGALNCALSTEGIQALFEAIDQMPRRPDWAAYIIPPQVDIKKLNKQLDQWEKDYFHGRLQ
jgi:hypothetical protein